MKARGNTITGYVFCLMCGLLLVTGCGNNIRIKTYIDGADTVKIQGNKVWYEHETFDLPGNWHGRNAPTMINGKPWIPVWHDNTSEPYEHLEPVFKPQSPAKIKLKKNLGRGEVTISERPSPQNNQTVSLHFVDDAPGADWYDVTVNWK
jgi:hypothetical protein